MEHISIRMLGEFSLQTQNATISDSENRAKKVWSLLAYLICNRGRTVSAQKLIDLLWGEESGSNNPENALRITLHRLRASLDPLWPNAGRELILRKGGGYCWNSDADITLDCDRFETLCQQDQKTDDQFLADLLEALSLYGGEFLPRQSSEMWVAPISTHFHNQFLMVSMEAARRLSAKDRHEEAANLCRTAAAAEPYHEGLHQMLICELAAAGDRSAADAVYQALSKRLFDDFGIRPTEQTREVYRSIAHTPEDRTLPIDEVLEQIQEPEAGAGAMVCDYDHFKVLCFAESRAMERNGNATHIALLGLAGDAEATLTKRSFSRIMDQLGESLRLNLRQGDTVSRCSVSQYIIMLPKANYEDSCMVCRRCIAAFTRAHPHVAAKVNFMVQPLTPSIRVP